MMSVSPSYKMVHIDQNVIKPALEELKPYFKNLRYKKYKDERKAGKPESL